MDSKLQKIIADYFQVEQKEINKETVAADISGWDSFSHMDLISTIEDQLKIDIPFDAIMEFECVGDIDAFIQNQ